MRRLKKALKLLPPLMLLQIATLLSLIAAMVVMPLLMLKRWILGSL